MGTETSMVICGLPQSGKSTFLAALWHLITSREIATRMKFESLRNVDASHLNALASRWRDARRQDRTALASNMLVSMNLIDDTQNPIRLTFPDLSGEAFSRMWEKRDCDRGTADILSAGMGILLFIHADQILFPDWVINIASLSARLGIPLEPGQEVAWDAKLAPTQVKVVGLLQLLRGAPLKSHATRVAIMLTAWDRVEAEGLEPPVFLATRLPLLQQYLSGGADRWEWRTYGVSAQGGEYEPDPTSGEEVPDDLREEVRKLREISQPSRRIRLVNESGLSHDLTEPLVWLRS